MRPTAENWSCGFEPLKGAFVCGQPAVWHGFRLTEDRRKIHSMMASCGLHKERMASNADYVHEMATCCGLPGSRFSWPENYCHADMDFGVLVQVSFAEALP
jgi:hypothetical protein